MELSKNTDIKYSLNHNDGCIYCKSSHYSHDYSFNFCRKQYVISSTNHSILSEAIKLMNDSDYIKQCPIQKSDPLYPYVSQIIKSESSIFQQVSMIENRQIIIYNKTNNIPPKWEELPVALQNEYTFHNTTLFKHWYLNNVQNENKNWKLVWTKQDINNQIITVQNGSISQLPRLPYGAKPAQQFYNFLTSAKYANRIMNANVIVIGSQQPWLEVSLLAAGVSHVTTAEYGVIEMGHPKMTWIHPSKFNESYIDMYDIAIQFSSLEHSGLGRYGDPIDPIGDVKMMNQISCLVKPNGLMFYGTPVSDDCIAWNAHRYYGPKRLRLMFMQWRIIDAVGDFDFTECKVNQPWIVLQNKRGCFG
eukprot:286701_1